MNGRIDAVRAALDAESIDAILLAAPPNVFYLCGFRPDPYERLIALVITRAGDPQLVCPALEQEAARAAVGEGVQLHVWRDDEGPAQALKSSLSAVGNRLGVEKQYLSMSVAELVADQAPTTTLVGCDVLLSRMRAVKSAEELALHRHAAAIVDRVVTEIGSSARPGQSEASLAAEAALRLRAEGSGDLPFDPLVLCGRRSALPHGRPGPQEVAEGDLLLIDISASYAGYCADITRMFVVGAEPDARQHEIFEIVRAAQRAGIEAVRAGAAAHEVDAAARAIIAAAGYGPNFIHRTGHGLGLEIHEPPYLSAAADVPLVAGMVVTVEPGVYIDDWGGVRIEDDVVVREGDAEILTTAPIEFVGALA